MTWLDRLLEATDTERAELLSKLRENGYDFVDEAKIGNYEMILWHGQNVQDGKPTAFYEISLNQVGKPFIGAAAQAGRQSGGTMDLLGRKHRVFNKLDEWLDKYGTIYVGSHDQRKLRLYHSIIQRYMPHIMVSRPFKGFDDSTEPDYFTLNHGQRRLAFESTSARDLFKHNEAAVEYRPVKRPDGEWDWYWVLLPLPDETEALDSGMENSRGAASGKARQAARRKGRRIAKVRVTHHALK